MLSNVRFRSSGAIPRNMREGSAKIVTCRQTILGIHPLAPPSAAPPAAKPSSRARKAARRRGEQSQAEDAPNGTTKTTLLVFSELKVASKIVNELKSNGFAHYPLEIETIDVSDIEKLCIMSFFDMYLLYNVLQAPNHALHADCYSFHTTELPNRQFLNFYLKGLA